MSADQKPIALSGKEFFSDPYPVYARLRESPAPVRDAETGAWLVGRYTQVEALLADVSTTKQTSNGGTPFEQAVLSRDPPEHTRMRRLLNQAFAGTAMAGLEERVTRIADKLIDSMAGRCDFIRAFALPLPVEVICEIMGIAREDTEQLHQWSAAFLPDATLTPEASGARQYAAAQAMTAYFAERVDRAGAERAEGLIGDLLRTRYEGQGLSRDEVIGNCMLLLIAGHETTVNLLSNGMYLLLEQRERFECVKQDQELLRTGIEEMLRYESPVQLGTFRLAREAVEVAGQTIERGEQITLVLGAANRDALQFPDPDRFDMARTPNRHLGFGHGPHRCIGAAVARTEARIGFQRLLERVPDLRLDREDALPKKWWRLGLERFLAPPPVAGMDWRQTAVTRGLKELWVRT